MSAFEAEAEEQMMEAEALESILVDDFKVISTSPYHFAISLAPHPAGDGIENHVAITLEAQLPPAYPNEAPTLEVVGVKGLSTDQVATLQGMADAAAAENLGMAMCYTVAEELREWLVAHNEKPQDDSMFAAMQRREVAAAKPSAEEVAAAEAAAAAAAGRSSGQALTEEEAEVERLRQKELDGTPVTPESFAEWRAKFEAETAPAKEAKVDTKKSGRDYFTEGADVGAWREPTEAEQAAEEAAAAAEELEAWNAKVAAREAKAAARAAAASGDGGGGGGVGAAVGDAGLFLDDDEDDDSDFELDDDDDDDDDDDEGE